MRHEHATIDAFDTSCFSGEYVTGDVSPAYLANLEVTRADAARAKRDARVLREERDGYGGDDTMQAAGGL